MKGVRPNLLVIVVDTLRADFCLGEGRSTVTPVIDRLARTGTVFLKSISSTSYTTPNFASLLTGRYSPGHGIRCFMDILNNVPTLPGILSSRGYSTYAEVTGPLKPSVGLDRDFGEYRYRSAHRTVQSGWGEELLERVRSFQPPWFCLLHLWAVHQPRIVPRRYDKTRYGSTLYERSISALDEKLGEIIDAAGPDTIVLLTGDHGEYVPRTWLEDRADRYKSYYMLLKRMNVRIRGLLEKNAKSIISRVKRSHLQKKSFSSSGFFQVSVPHGEHIYDYLIRTPLIISYPPLFPAKTIIDQFEQIDILPTILGAMGLDFPEDINGRNFYPLINQDIEMPSRPAYLECTYTQHRPEKDQWLIGLRTNREKFIFAPFNNEIAPELYNLEQDPEEEENIADRSREKVEKYREIALKYFSRGNEEKTELSGREKNDMIETLRGLGYLD